jgi:hypothetical protein
VVENALPREIADTLLTAMPPVDVFLQGHAPGSNVRFALPSPQAFDHPGVSAEWKEALRVCVAGLPLVLDRTLSRSGGYIRRTYPDFERKFGPVSGLRATPRYAPGRQPHEVGMDAQMVINTPALSGGTSVRGPHLDRPTNSSRACFICALPVKTRSAANCSSTPPPPAGSPSTT